MILLLLATNVRRTSVSGVDVVVCGSLSLAPSGSSRPSDLSASIPLWQTVPNLNGDTETDHR